MRPPINDDTIESLVEKLVETMPKSATPNAKTTHLICWRSTPEERRNRWTSEKTDAPKNAGNRMAIAGSKLGSRPTASI